MQVVAIDISGRHKMPDGRYLLVCVAISAGLSPLNIQHIDDMKVVRRFTDGVSVEDVAGVIGAAAARFDGVIVSEHGEFYGYPEWRVEAIIGRKFKYAESIGERRAIEVAHHVSLAVHRLLQEIDVERNTGQENRPEG
ncbi:MAG: hypothetical protein A4E28_00918 [Methanocella sp. PtaU1.Bin125]|nr:MAG: hypothetical protein A4E28_00918 [Methanocella sp. PtaU1.Bin125]